MVNTESLDGVDSAERVSEELVVRAAGMLAVHSDQAAVKEIERTRELIELPEDQWRIIADGYAKYGSD